MRIAALDLGSNTFLCLIADGNHGKIEKVLFDEVQTVRLGQGLSQSKEFHPDALDRADKCLELFKQKIDSFNVEKIQAMATAAARDATNSDKLFSIGKKWGIPIKIISGKDEARLTYLGATFDLKKLDNNILVVDIGGGSTELIVGKGKDILFSHSINIGGVKLTEKFVTHQPINILEQEEMQHFIVQELNNVLKKSMKNHSVDAVVAVAGTPTSIAAIEMGGFSEKKVNGFILSADRLKYWRKVFADSSVEEKKTKFGLGGRSDIIFAGASILHELMCSLNKNELMVSTRGVRNGMAIEMLS